MWDNPRILFEYCISKGATHKYLTCSGFVLLFSLVHENCYSKFIPPCDLCKNTKTLLIIWELYCTSKLRKPVLMILHYVLCREDTFLQHLSSHENPEFNPELPLSSIKQLLKLLPSPAIMSSIRDIARLVEKVNEELRLLRRWFLFRYYNLSCSILKIKIWGGRYWDLNWNWNFVLCFLQYFTNCCEEEKKNILTKEITYCCLK